MIKTGFGFDIHRLKECNNSFILLAGCKINANKKIIAHSDGDVLFHSLSNAILSSIGEDDIGSFFPNYDEKLDNMDSLIILNKALCLLRENNFHLININIDIILDDIKLSSYKKKIKNRLSSLLSLKDDCISIHANTSEGLLVNDKSAIIVLSNILVEKD